MSTSTNKRRTAAIATATATATAPTAHVPRPRRQGAAMVALLRGINVGGNKRVPMTELRELAQGLGFTQVASYIQSGNLVFVATLTPSAAQATLEAAIEKHFGFSVAVMVRTQAQWQALAAASPFPDAQTQRPKHLLLGICQHSPKAGAQAALQAGAKAGERVAVTADAVWIDYAESIGTSKLTPALLDRAVGCVVTARNWSTVQALAQMLEEAAQALGR